MIVWKHALVTGGTGALGPALAAELLCANPAGTLAVLMRSGGGSLDERFNPWLHSVAETIGHRHIAGTNWRNRIIPVAGDVRQPDFGIAPNLNAKLLGRTDLVIHAAADTQFKSVSQEQWDTNVEGTRHALAWTRACTTRARIICVSTICTSGKRTGRIVEQFTPNPPEFVNNYESTKWEAEKLAMESGLRFAIARVSIVMGSHTSGAVYRPGALHQIFKWFGRGLVPVIQGTDQTPMDLISTEPVVSFLAKASMSNWDSGTVWHVAAGDRAVPLLDLSALAFRELHGTGIVQNIYKPGTPFIVDSTTYDQVRENYSTRRERVTRQALDALATFLPMLTYPRTYDTRRAEQLWGGPLPLPDWRITMARAIRYLGMTGLAEESTQLRRRAG